MTGEELRERIVEILKTTDWLDRKAERILALLPTEGEPVAVIRSEDLRDEKHHPDICYRRMGGYQQWLHGDRETWTALFTTPQESAEVELWECPDCAFGFDIGHEDVEGGWSCPVCAEERLETEVERLRSALEKMECRCLPHAKPGDGQCDRCAALNPETDG